MADRGGDRALDAATELDEPVRAEVAAKHPQLVPPVVGDPAAGDHQQGAAGPHDHRPGPADPPHERGLGERDGHRHHADHQTHAERVRQEQQQSTWDRAGPFAQARDDDGQEWADRAAQRRQRVGGAEQRHRGEGAGHRGRPAGAGDQGGQVSTGEQPAAGRHEESAENQRDPGQPADHRPAQRYHQQAEQAEHRDETSGHGRGQEQRSADRPRGAAVLGVRGDQHRQVRGEQREAARVHRGHQPGSQRQGQRQAVQRSTFSISGRTSSIVTMSWYAIVPSRRSTT